MSELQKEFEEKFVSQEDNPDRDSYGETYIDAEWYDVWLWIEQKLKEACKEQREKYYYHIENSSGTKEADYIDKMVNAPEPSEPKGDVE